MDPVIHILIVDDDASTRKTLSSILQLKGYVVEEAATGQAALAAIARQAFDLALLDIRLPDMEGVELLLPFKQRYPDIVLIMATGYASVETAIRAVNEKADAYMPKPLNMDAVLLKVQDLLERQHLRRENQRLHNLTQQELLERRHSERALRESEEKYRLLAETVHDMILLHNMEGEITYINQAGSDLLEIEKKDLIGNPIAELFPIDQRRIFAAQQEHLVTNEKQMHQYETVIVNDAGKRIPAEISATRFVRQNQLSGILLVVRDITRRKRTEEKLSRQLTELQRWHALTLNRETRVLALKAEINALLRRLDEPIRYPSAEHDIEELEQREQNQHDAYPQR